MDKITFLLVVSTSNSLPLSLFGVYYASSKKEHFSSTIVQRDYLNFKRSMAIVEHEMKQHKTLSNYE